MGGISEQRQDEIDLDILRTRDPRVFVLITAFGWEFYAKSPNPIIRKEVARHPKCPTHVRDKLIHDADAGVRSLAVEFTKNVFQPLARYPSAAE